MRATPLTLLHQFYPGALYVISLFYTRKEIALRLAILTTGNNFSGSFAGLIAAGVFQLDKRLGLAGWQWYAPGHTSISHSFHN
jgi:hypothetical protein